MAPPPPADLDLGPLLQERWGVSQAAAFSECASYDDRLLVATGEWRRHFVHWVQREEGVGGEAARPPGRSPLRQLEAATSTCAAGQQRWVVKVHNSQDSGAPGFLEAQDSVMAHLARLGFPVNQPLAMLGGGGCIARLALGSSGSVHAVRVLTYLPGTLLRDAPHHCLVELAGAVGELLGNVDRALLAYDDERLRRDHEWNLACLPATHARLRPQLAQLVASADDL